MFTSKTKIERYKILVSDRRH